MNALRGYIIRDIIIIADKMDPGIEEPIGFLIDVLNIYVD